MVLITVAHHVKNEHSIKPTPTIHISHLSILQNVGIVTHTTHLKMED